MFKFKKVWLLLLLLLIGCGGAYEAVVDTTAETSNDAVVGVRPVATSGSSNSGVIVQEVIKEIEVTRVVSAEKVIEGEIVEVEVMEEVQAEPPSAVIIQQSVSATRIPTTATPWPTQAAEHIQADEIIQVPQPTQGIIVEKATDDTNLGIPVATVEPPEGYPYRVPQHVYEQLQRPPYNAMTFQNYGSNPFVWAIDDSQSTFAMDVDSGAYTIMRNYVENGSLPPAAAVRVEEYVNYFDYDYAQPSEGAFSINLAAAPNPYSIMPEAKLLRVGIQGMDVDQSQRPDLTLILVVDTSGSMDQNNRLGLVKESLALLLTQLRPTDRVGVIAYGDQAQIIIPPTSASDAANINRAVYNLRTSGSTNTESGLRLAYQMAGEYALPAQQTRVLLLSDGVANVGNTTADLILENAREGVLLSTFGVGLGNYNDTLMEQLADQGDGTYAYIDTLDEAERLFVRDATGTLVTIARDAKIQVEFNPNVVAAYRLMGYENRDIADSDFRNNSVDAGEVGAGHNVTALYEIVLNADYNPNESMLTARVRYQAPGSGDIVEQWSSLTPNEMVNEFVDAPASMQLAAVIAQYADLLRGSPWATHKTMEDLLVDSFRVAAQMPENADVRDFVILLSEAASLDKYANNR